MPGFWDQFGDATISAGGAVAGNQNFASAVPQVGDQNFEQGNTGPSGFGASGMLASIQNQFGPMSPEGQPAAGGGGGAFDPGAQVGHDGTTGGGMSREAYRDAWMGSGAKSMGDLQAFVSKNGGTINAGNGTVTTPYGEQIDMLANARGSANGQGTASASWGGVGGPSGSAGGGPGDGASMPTGLAGAFGGGGGSYGGGGGAFGGGGGSRPSYTGPDFAAQNIDLPTNYTPRAISGPDQYTPERVSTPDALQLSRLQNADPFKATTADDVKNDPSYQFRLKTQMDALQNSAAAKGLLRGTNTAQGLMDTAGQMASQEYGNIDARRREDYQTGLQDRLNVGNFNNTAGAQEYGLSNQYKQQAETTNAGNALSAWGTYQGMRQNADQFNASREDNANQSNFANTFAVKNANNSNSLAAFQANTNAKLGYGNLDLGNKQADNSYSLGQGQLALGNKSADQNFYLGNRAADTSAFSAQTGRMGTEGNLGLGWANYGLNADQQNFNQGYSLADMGLRAAGQQGAYGGAYAAQSGANATGAGNAAAAGRVGSANAWNNGMTGAFNAGMGAYGAYQYGQQGGG